jgi:hypothetical protein
MVFFKRNSIANSIDGKYNGDENPALTAVTGCVNGDTINYTLATTATQF